MTWCHHCGKDCETGRDYSTGSVCCASCGKVIDQDVFAEEPTFVKGPGGESRLAGSKVRSVLDDYSESHRRTLEKGNTIIYEFIDKFGITDVAHATLYYRIAVERGFTKGRRTAHVAAACLYIACREKEKSFLLIDFSSHLSVNVYELGAVYLQLCKLLSLEEHPFIQKPIDPSLFMHRFTSALVKDGSKKVLPTALRIVASMKRDWMQTGRKPSGICAAALYVSTLLHGLRYSKSDILRIVHICEATLTQRLIEFEHTKSGSLTIEEFNKHAEEFEKEMQSCKQSDLNPQKLGSTTVLCEHKGKAAHSGYGLCQSCYLEFVGGVHGGANPPAFQRAEMARLSKASVELASESSFDGEHDLESCENEGVPFTEANQCAAENEKIDFPESVASDVNGNPDITSDAFEKCEDMPAAADETDTLSDIDDVEVDIYLNNEEESRYKKIIWEEMNKEYLQEQAAKEAAAEAARKLYSEASNELRSAKELAAASNAAVASSREKRRQKRAAEAKITGPAQTAAEATRQMLTRKRLSSKINFEVLDKLFGDDPSETTKKSRIEDVQARDARGKEEREAEKGKLGDEEGEGEDEEEDYNRAADGADDNKWECEDGRETYDYDYEDQDGFEEDF